MLRRSCQLAFLLLSLVLGACVVVDGQATVDFTFAPTDPGVGEEVCFTASVVTGAPAWFVLYEWDFDQDGIYDSTGQGVCHNFPTEGVKPVTLRATDDRGGFHFVQHNYERPVSGTLRDHRTEQMFHFLLTLPQGCSSEGMRFDFQVVKICGVREGSGGPRCNPASERSLACTGRTNKKNDPVQWDLCGINSGSEREVEDCL